jgi:hypothetical protein
MSIGTANDVGKIKHSRRRAFVQPNLRSFGEAHITPVGVTHSVRIIRARPKRYRAQAW